MVRKVVVDQVRKQPGPRDVEIFCHLPDSSRKLLRDPVIGFGAPFYAVRQIIHFQIQGMSRKAP